MNLKISYNSVLLFLLSIFPLLMILGSATINLFCVIFSIYALLNYKLVLKLIFSQKKIFLYLFFSIFAILPYHNIDVSFDFQNSFWKSIFYFRYILMTFGIVLFLNKNNNSELTFKKYYVILLFVISIDVIKEHLTGTNFLGYSSIYNGRIASFTNPELIIGYIFCFISLFCFDKFLNIKRKYLIIPLIFYILIISFIIGERSNFLKLFILITVFYTFIYLSENNFKIINFIKVFLFCLTISTVFFVAIKDTKQASKFFDYNNISKISNFEMFINNLKHTPHYSTALKIFYNNPIFGIGINNFREESKKEKYSEKKYKFDGNRSSTHAHQLYLEILSETGILGIVYFLVLFVWSIYLSLKNYVKNNNIQIIPHLLLNLFFIFPLLPSGSFFGTIYGLPFWYNFAIILYISQKNDLRVILK